jgi:hypothetical protein
MLIADLWQKRSKGDDELALRVRVPARTMLYAAAMLAFLWFGEFGGERFIYFQF